MHISGKSVKACSRIAFVPCVKVSVVGFRVSMVGFKVSMVGFWFQKHHKKNRKCKYSTCVNLIIWVCFPLTVGEFYGRTC